MSRQGISTGSAPNDGTGDTLLVGAKKTNENFQEIYDALGDGTDLLTGDPNLTVGFITATGAYFNGDVGIAGTLTYEDVTNIDSVGLITARDGISVLGAGITVTGISTFYSSTTIGAASTFTDTGLSVAANIDTDTLNVSGVSTFNNNVSLGGTGGVSNITGLSRLELYDSAANVVIGNSQTADSIDLDLVTTIENVFIGIGVGQNFVQGNGNNFIGFFAGKQNNPSGSDYAYLNNIIGYLAAQKLTSGSNNQGIGEQVLNKLTSGNRNIAIGNYAGLAVTTGDYNILLGESANVTNGSDSFNIVIGKDITVNGNNNLAIGIDGEKLITGVKDGSVDLYYDNSKKFETTSDGVDVTGIVSATDAVTANYFQSTSGISTNSGTTAAQINVDSTGSQLIITVPGVGSTTLPLT